MNFAQGLSLATVSLFVMKCDLAGWWKYDERSNDELEAAWNTGATECSLLLAGAVYCIDFSSMVQTRRNDRTRRRHVRRDAPTLPAKGIFRYLHLKLLVRLHFDQVYSLEL